MSSVEYYESHDNSCIYDARLRPAANANVSQGYHILSLMHACDLLLTQMCRMGIMCSSLCMLVSRDLLLPQMCHKGILFSC